MAHDHAHHHRSSINKAYYIGIGLNVAYVVIQIVIGLKISSLSLLSDAGHNFLDVASLIASFVSMQMAFIPANKNFTFGYKKVSILVSLVNSLILFVSVAFIAYEAYHRFRNQTETPGLTIAWVALVGIFINALSAYMFWSDSKHDINVRSAFLHLAYDALVSMGLVVGGVLIYFTKIQWIDPLLSVIICIVIAMSTWGLLKESIKLAIDGVPSQIDLPFLKTELCKIQGIDRIISFNVWALSTLEDAGMLHIQTNNHDQDAIQLMKSNIRALCHEHHIEQIAIEID